MSGAFPLPRYVPMLASTWPQPFDDRNWGFEAKWDGVRILVYWDGETTELRSRRGLDVTATYPELSAFHAERPCVLDGEIVAFDENGRPSFQALQGRMNLTGAGRVAELARKAPVTFMAFDLLFDDGELVNLPLLERRARLDHLYLPPPVVRSPLVEQAGRAFSAAAIEQGLEGMVGKLLDSPYRPGIRSPDWRKVSHVRSIRAVVGGYTLGEGGRARTFGSLLVGLWEGPQLRYVGSVGTGFDDRALRAIRGALDELGREDRPFSNQPEARREVRWVEPRLVAMVEFKEWTSGGRLRAPSFKGFTDDPPEAATWQAEGPGA